MIRLARKIIISCADTAFVRKAIAERADLAAFAEKPTLTVLLGVTAIILSFLLGWPAVAVLGFWAAKLDLPWLIVIGGPLVYGLSHLVFLLGMYLSGTVYSLIFCRWLARITFERCLVWAERPNQHDPLQP